MSNRFQAYKITRAIKKSANYENEQLSKGVGLIWFFFMHVDCHHFDLHVEKSFGRVMVLMPARRKKLCKGSQICPEGSILHFTLPADHPPPFPVPDDLVDLVQMTLHPSGH